MERPFSAYKGSEPYIFVSYAHDDAAQVYPEISRLKDQGFNIWYDEGISPGSTWRDEVALALTQCSVFLFFVSPRSIESHNCQQELNFSLSRERKMLTVHIEDTELPPGMELSLSDKQAIVLSHHANDAWLPKLIESLRAILPRDLEPIAILQSEPLLEVDPDEKSIAVLPLENRSSDPENEYLSDGISEEIIAGLAKVTGLRVASEIASFAMKNQDHDLETMGSRLGVETVLSGSVRKVGNRVRINVLLNRVIDGSTLWTDRYDREMDDIFELQDDVVRQVIEALKIELGTEETEHGTGTENAEAYEQFLQGSYKSRQQTIKGWHEALVHLKRAIELDPNFIEAYVRLIWPIMWLMNSEGDPTGDLLAEAARIQQQMIVLDPQKSHKDWLLVEGFSDYVLNRDEWAVRQEIRSRNIIRHASLYHPNYVAAAYGDYADVCRVLGLYHAELEFWARARDMEVTNLYMESQGWAALGYFDRAIDCLDEQLRTDPQMAAAQSDRAIYLSRTGQYQAAKRDLDSLNAIWGPRHFPAFCYWYWHGDVDEANACFDWLASRKNFDPYYKGCCSIMLGNTEAGLNYLEQAADTTSGVIGLMRILNDTYLSQSQLDELYSNSRYQDLLNKIHPDEDRQKIIDGANKIKDITGIEVRFDEEYQTP